MDHCGVHYSVKLDECNIGDVGDGLAEWSPRDRPWDIHRSQAQDVQAIYEAVAAFERYAERISRCSGLLRFAWEPNPDTGEVVLRLREAHFCRVRYCPVCQWRRTLMWLARFYKALPDIQRVYPTARWLFLTLTVRNCLITELGATLTAMNAAWQRLKDRTEFKPVLGWVRTTEVTRGQDGSAHPHFHCLLMVPPSMASGKLYVTHSRWVELWQEAARLDYTPVVDIRAVKDKGKAKGEDAADPLAGLRWAAAEVLKYAVKPQDMTTDPAWFLELTRQVHRRRFVATGGVLKYVLRVEYETDKDLALLDDGLTPIADDGSRLAFNWRSDERRYRRYPKADKPPRPHTPHRSP